MRMSPSFYLMQRLDGAKEHASGRIQKMNGSEQNTTVKLLRYTFILYTKGKSEKMHPLCTPFTRRVALAEELSSPYAL